MLLLLYTQEAENDRAAVKGMVIVTKEPYFTAHYESGYVVRVDHTSDIL